MLQGRSGGLCHTGSPIKDGDPSGRTEYALYFGENSLQMIELVPEVSQQYEVTAAGGQACFRGLAHAALHIRESGPDEFRLQQGEHLWLQVDREHLTEFSDSSGQRKCEIAGPCSHIGYRHAGAKIQLFQDFRDGKPRITFGRIQLVSLKM